MLSLASAPQGLWAADVRAVHGAAALLRIPEFALFHLAYRRWHGSAASDQQIEPHFVTYLFRQRAPIWVRHLAREVLGRDAEADVRPEDFGVRPTLPPRPQTGRWQGLQCLLLAMVYGTCFLLVTLCAL